MYVRNKMTVNPYTVSPSQSVIDAQELIAKHGVKRLPVVKNGKLVGLVTSRDISRYTPSKATSLSMGEISYLLSKTKISSIMTKDPITISPDSLLEEAATLMRDNDVGCLPVVEGDKVVGIITESNLLDAFIELLGFREPGTRLTIEAVDAPGILSRLAGITASTAQTSRMWRFIAARTEKATWSSVRIRSRPRGSKRVLSRKDTRSFTSCKTSRMRFIFDMATDSFLKDRIQGVS